MRGSSETYYKCGHCETTWKVENNNDKKDKIVEETCDKCRRYIRDTVNNFFGDMSEDED